MENYAKVLGMLLVVMLGIVFALTLLPTIGNQVAVVNKVVTTSNQTINLAAAGATLNGIYVSNVLVTNSTGSEIVPSTNYTISNLIGAGGGGTLSAKITPTSDSAYKNTNVNVSYVYEPTGYAHGDIASQSIIGLIVIFAALGIAIFAFPNLREMIGEKLGL